MEPNIDPPLITGPQLDYIEVLLDKCKNGSHFIQYHRRYTEIQTRQEASKLIQDMREELDAG